MWHLRGVRSGTPGASAHGRLRADGIARRAGRDTDARLLPCGCPSGGIVTSGDCSEPPWPGTCRLWSAGRQTTLPDAAASHHRRLFASGSRVRGLPGLPAAGGQLAGGRGTVRLEPLPSPSSCRPAPGWPHRGDRVGLLLWQPVDALRPLACTLSGRGASVIAPRPCGHHRRRGQAADGGAAEAPQPLGGGRGQMRHTATDAWRDEPQGTWCRRSSPDKRRPRRITVCGHTTPLLPVFPFHLRTVPPPRPQELGDTAGTPQSSRRQELENTQGRTPTPRRPARGSHRQNERVGPLGGRQLDFSE